MIGFLHDLRYGLRLLAKSPGFAAIAVLTFALGIGATTAIFSVVNSVLLRPLPYQDPERIVTLGLYYRDKPQGSSFYAREFDFWQQHRDVFAHLAASTGAGFNLTGTPEPQRVRGLRVSSAYFDVFAVRPFLGRTFTKDEDSPSGANVAILSHGLWTSQFASDPQVVGKTVSLDGQAYTVLAVMPAGFQSIPTADLWTTIAQVNNTVGSGANYFVLARLRDGVSRVQAHSYLQSAKKAFFEQFRSGITPKEISLVAFRAVPLSYAMVSDYRLPLLALFGAVAFVLLIACVNVTSLLLARFSSRTREFAVRTALGAGRARLLRQLLAESLVLSICGGILALFFAYWILNLVLGLLPPDLPRAQEISLDRWALAFTALVTILSAILSGTLPAFYASRTDLNASLKESNTQFSSSRARQRLRSVLVVAQLALSIVLLVGAALLMKTFANLIGTNPGFNPHHILSLQIWPMGEKFTSTPAMTDFDRKVVQSLQAIPGVESAAVVNAGVPLEQGGNEYIQFLGRSQPDGASVDFREITPQYFLTLGVPLLRGRFFNDADSSDSIHAAIINQALQRQFYAGRSPLGERFVLEDQPWEIVGVVADVRSYLNEPAPPTVFIPDAQSPAGASQLFMTWFPASVLVRTGHNPLSISKDAIATIRGIDSAVPVGKVRSMDEVLSTSIAFQKFLMTLLTTFAALALLLATIGVYGVMAYFVSQRTHEIGLRMALGALPSDCFKIVVRRGMFLAFIGVLIGLGGALALTRLIAAQLYDVQATDPLAYIVVTFAVAIPAFIASWIPARRATSVDPCVALRHE
jgi:putative ABC transport system permease protein